MEGYSVHDLMHVFVNSWLLSSDEFLFPRFFLLFDILHAFLLLFELILKFFFVLAEIEISLGHLFLKVGRVVGDLLELEVELGVLGSRSDFKFE